MTDYEFRRRVWVSVLAGVVLFWGAVAWVVLA